MTFLPAARLKVDLSHLSLEVGRREGDVGAASEGSFTGKLYQARIKVVSQKCPGAVKLTSRKTRPSPCVQTEDFTMSSSSPRPQELSPTPLSPAQKPVPANLTIYPVSQTEDLPQCLFCKRSENHQEKYGQLITDKDSGITVHYFCLLLSSGIHQAGDEEEGIYGFRQQEVMKEYRRGLRLKCSFCGHNGATIGCCFKKCKMAFHLPCGMENGSLHLFFDDFKSYCQEHRPMQVISKDMILDTPEKKPVCPICMYRLTAKPSFDVLKTPCCKRTWLHRDCVQRQASSAGVYFFRCPICNAKETFQKEMLKNGIYIPERDASWELEDNAFQELLQRYSHCDAENCVCDKGRDFHTDRGKWRIAICKVCGSSGTHMLCSQLKKALIWQCKDCTEILAKAKKAAIEKKMKEKEEKKQQAKAAKSKKENKVKEKLKVRRSSKKGKNMILSGRPMSDERRILGRNCRVVLTPLDVQYTRNQPQLGLGMESSQTSSDDEVIIGSLSKHKVFAQKPVLEKEEAVESVSSDLGSDAHTLLPTGLTSTTDKKTKGTSKKKLKRPKASSSWTKKEQRQKVYKKAWLERKNSLDPGLQKETNVDTSPAPLSPEIDVCQGRSRVTPTSCTKLGLYLSPSSDDEDNIPLARLSSKVTLRKKLFELRPFAGMQSSQVDKQSDLFMTSPMETSEDGGKGEETELVSDEQQSLPCCDEDAAMELTTKAGKDSPGPFQTNSPKQADRIPEEPSTPDTSVTAPLTAAMLLRSGSHTKPKHSETSTSRLRALREDGPDLSPLTGQGEMKEVTSEEALVPKVRKQTARKSCQPYLPCRRTLLEYTGQTERQPSPSAPEESSSAKTNPAMASEHTSCSSPNGSVASGADPMQTVHPDMLDLPECRRAEEDLCHTAHHEDSAVNISSSMEVPAAIGDPDVVVEAVHASPTGSQSSSTASASSCLACLIAARRRTMGPLFIDLTEDMSNPSSEQEDIRPSSPSTVTLSSSDTDTELELEVVAETPLTKKTNRTCLPGIPTKRRSGSDSSTNSAIGPTKNNNFLRKEGEGGMDNVTKSAKSKGVGHKVKKKSGGKGQRSKSMGDIGKIRGKSRSSANKYKLSRKDRARRKSHLRIKWPDPFCLQFRSTNASSEQRVADVPGVTMHVEVNASPRHHGEGQAGQKRKRSNSLTGSEVDVPSISVKVTTTPTNKRWSSPLSCEQGRAREDVGVGVGTGGRMATRQTPLKPTRSTTSDQEGTSARTPSRLAKKSKVLTY